MASYICNCQKPVDHCREVCLHGRGPHKADECSFDEYCEITKETVKCRKIGARELKKYKESQNAN